MKRDLTKGSVVNSMLLFAIPMILGDLLQQCYTIADTLIVGQFLGRDALAAVGSSFTLMTFLTSVILDLCCDFHWHFWRFPVQLFCLFPAVDRQFRHTVGFFSCFRCAEYCP